jgi:glucose-6-phosphate 1-dehydrogenase
MNQVYRIAAAQPVPPCTLVIFGASGDLARRKLIPALYNLWSCGPETRPERFAVLGFARRPIELGRFRDEIRGSVARFSRLELDSRCWGEFSASLDYLSGLDQTDGFTGLRKRLEQIEAAHRLPPNRVYYFAIPPQAVPGCVERLDAAGLISAANARHFTRVVIEKPIGSDLDSALEINRILHRHFDESQIFRIDHYLGKETVQNLLVLRFANTMFERMWGARNVDHVQITVAESEGVGSRAVYYDPTGALRDIVQNHVMQLLTLIAMEPPVSLDASAVRDAKLNVLRALRPLGPDEVRRQVVRARYASGTINGEPVCGYLDEKGVPQDSRAETFVALRTSIDNWRWAGVPFYIRTGKRLATRATIIRIQFKDVPQILFNRGTGLAPNALTIRIQPDEGFNFDVLAKQPGLDLAIRPVRMNLRYESEFSGPSPDAYERLLLDVMAGDHTLFVSAAFVEKSWEFADSIVNQWSRDPTIPLDDYPAGTFGPEAADRLIGTDGRSWSNP